MLHRSFKSAKCKTALKLASSRIKLLKNKKLAQVKELKRELAHLLESGQDRTARIRVEHVVREEKTVAAYELIEIYCELIVARLPIIESQKNCPIDLKEAISSLIFASPRCADIPELVDVRKHFTAKYGKDFISAAVELRPDCGVGRMLIEKLSAKAPDGQTKMKILSAIAQEHNVKWDPNSLEEKPPEDLLSGPNTFEQASKVLVQPSHVQAPPNRDDKGPPNVQVPPTHDASHDVSGNLYEQSSRSSSRYQNVDSADVGAKKSTMSGTFHSEVGSSGTGTEEKESRHSYSEDVNAFSRGRQNWNMEFKDATAAAQAAAESAERASMAARAAIELSSRGRVTGQYSMESHRSSAYGLSSEGSQKYAGSKLQGEQLAKGPVNNAFPQRNSGMHDEQIDRSEQDNLVGAADRFFRDDHQNFDRSSRSTSLKSNTASIDNNQLFNSSQKVDRYPQKNSFEPEKSDFSGEVCIERQSSTGSSHSHSSTFSDAHNDVSDLDHQKLGNDGGWDPFVIGEGNINMNSEDTPPYDNTALVFDEYDSDDGEHKFDVENQFKGQESSLYLPSPVNLLENTNAYKSFGRSFSPSHSFTEQHSSHVFSEGSTSSVVPSQPQDLTPVTYDDSDGPSSDEEDLDKSKHVGSADLSIYPHKQNVHSGNSEITQTAFQSASHGLLGSSSVEKWLPSSSVDSDPKEVPPETNKSIKFSVVSDKRLVYDDLTTGQPSPRLKESGLDSDIMDNDHTTHLPETGKDTELLKESSFESGNQLNFGTLTGGLRNKGIQQPRYSWNPSGNAPSFKQASRDTSSKIEQSSPTVRTSISSYAHHQEPNNQEVSAKQSKTIDSRASISSSDSDNDDSKEELSQRTISSSQEPYNQKAGTKVNKESSSRVPINYFHADSCDSEEDLPKQTSTSNARPVAGFSRRTKGTSPNTSSSYLKNTVLSEAPVTPDYRVERKSTSRSSNATETLPKSSFQTKNSHHSGSTEQHRSAELAASKPVQESKRPSSEESLKSFTKEQTSSSLPKTVTSGSTETSNYSSSGSPSKEKETSHVHTKLTDYATETLRKSSFKTKSSNHSGSTEQHRSAELAASKAMQESKRTLREESLKSSTKGQPSNSLPKILTSGSTETLNSSSSGTPSNEKERASHVHPKLPDYDSFAAHFQSLRQGRQ